jgi:hypothetical protein
MNQKDDSVLSNTGGCFSILAKRSALYLAVALSAAAIQAQTFPGCDNTLSLSIGNLVQGNISPAGNKDCWTFSVYGAEVLTLEITNVQNSLQVRVEVWTDFAPNTRLVFSNAVATGAGIVIRYPMNGLEGRLVANVQGLSGTTGTYRIRWDTGVLPVLDVSPVAIHETRSQTPPSIFSVPVTVRNSGTSGSGSFFGRGNPRQLRLLGCRLPVQRVQGFIPATAIHSTLCSILQD